MSPELSALRSITFSPTTIGWTRDPGYLRFHALGDLEEPIIALEPVSTLGGVFRLRLAFRRRGFSMVRFQFFTSHGKVQEVFLDLEQPHLMYHQLAHLTVYPGHDDDPTVLDADIVLAQGESLVKVHFLVEDWRNERFHPFYIPPEIRIVPTVPAGGFVEIVDVMVESDVQVRPGWPCRGLAIHLPNAPAIPKAEMRDAIVFASWVPESALNIGQHYIDIFRRHLPHAKYFVGINHGSSPTWVDLLQGSGLDVELSWTSEQLSTGWDAGGFVESLNLFRRSDERFKMVWFGHTKGASNPDYWHYWMVRLTQERRFWSQRGMIIRTFEDPRVGIYAPFWMLHTHLHSIDIKALQSIFPSEYEPIRLMAVSTFFVLRDSIVKEFCAEVPEAFWDGGPLAFGGSRFFFESGMPNIASLQGLEPYIPDGEGGTSLPLTASGRYSVLGDERQNHLLARRQLKLWRDDPHRFVPLIAPVLAPSALAQYFEDSEDRQNT